jgi:hypothetical protein
MSCPCCDPQCGGDADCSFRAKPCNSLTERDPCCPYYPSLPNTSIVRSKCCPGTCISGAHEFSQSCLDSIGYTVGGYVKDRCCPGLSYSDYIRANRTSITWKGRSATASREGDAAAEINFFENGSLYRAYAICRPSSIFGYWANAAYLQFFGTYPNVFTTERCPSSLSDMCERRTNCILAYHITGVDAGGKVINLRNEANFEESAVGGTDLPSLSISWRNNTGCTNPLP